MSTTHLEGTTSRPTEPKYPKFDATHVARVTTDCTLSKDKSKKARNPKVIHTSVVSVRTRWVGQYYTAGMSECAKLLVRKIREYDPSMQILPTNDDADDILIHEDDYNREQQDLWLRNTYYLHQGNNHSFDFTLAVKTTKTYKSMTESIISFMTSIGCRATCDTIQADRLVTI